MTRRYNGEIAIIRGHPNEWVAVDTSDPEWREDAWKRLEKSRQARLWGQT